MCGFLRTEKFHSHCLPTLGISCSSILTIYYNGTSNQSCESVEFEVLSSWSNVHCVFYLSCSTLQLILVQGCYNCRARKVKCNEAVPQCSPCQKRGITCSGYQSKLVWVTSDQKSYQPNGRRFLHCGSFASLFGT